MIESYILLVLFVLIAGCAWWLKTHSYGAVPVRKAAGNPIGTCMTIGDRELQQDQMGTALGDAGAIMVLADGIGRGQGGRIAARITVDTFLDLYNEYQAFDKPQYYFRRAFQAANHKILNYLEERQGEAAAAVALVLDDTLYYAVVGDVRLAVYRQGDLVPVSEGQTIDIMAKHCYEKGNISKQAALSFLDEHRRYNFLGRDDFQDIEYFSKPMKLRKGDVVLLMTDGVFPAIRWVDIEDQLKAPGTSKEKAYRIIEAVNQSKAAEKDNASVIIYQN